MDIGGVLWDAADFVCVSGRRKVVRHLTDLILSGKLEVV